MLCLGVQLSAMTSGLLAFVFNTHALPLNMSISTLVSDLHDLHD